MLGGLPVHHLVPPHVAGVVPGDLLPGAPDHQHALDVGALLDRLVDRGLERTRRAAAVAAVRGDDEVSVAVEDAAAQGVGGEAAEDDRVGRAETGTGQHGDDRLGDHRHVDGDLVPGPHPQLGEGVGGLADRGEQLGVGDGAGVARLALPVEGDPVTEPGRDVAVDAIDGHVELCRRRTTWRTGGSQSSTCDQGCAHVNRLAWASQKPRGSACASA